MLMHPIRIERTNETRQQDRLVDLQGLELVRRCGDFLRTSISIVEHRGSEIRGTYGVQRPIWGKGFDTRRGLRLQSDRYE